MLKISEKDVDILFIIIGLFLVVIIVVSTEAFIYYSIYLDKGI